MLKKYPLLPLAISAVFLPLSARAEIPPEVTAALSGLQVDAVAVAGIVLAAIVSVYAFKFIRKGL